ncbi:hypothetical protein BIZ37_09255 [Photobacterium sp. BZF1]|uniref:hypothetical protein n=1 Tax=Photobacterium sp. BZF1 TaxID=1904457 RepID=UPI001653D736|nr:hypothetical protein [Photobacterium sp. BZF1]MBC7002743.1 hypothetical protein [Photobacterium sp. BZF1]
MSQSAPYQSQTEVSITHTYFILYGACPFNFNLVVNDLTAVLKAVIAKLIWFIATELPA